VQTHALAAPADPIHRESLTLSIEHRSLPPSSFAQFDHGHDGLSD